MSHTTARLGMDLEVPSTAQFDRELSRNALGVCQEKKDHFINKNGVRCAGTHLIIDLYDACRDRLDDINHIEHALLECVEKAGATLLHIHLHRFEPNGISGVAVLAESHISIHSWPENGYAALDVFMCGDSHPERCIDVLRDAFKPQRTGVSEILRGQSVG
ncbi:MAG: adenosylmethionine decarboxylase [Stappiaceae bacterium]